MKALSYISAISALMLVLTVSCSKKAPPPVDAKAARCDILAEGAARLKYCEKLSYRVGKDGKHHDIRFDEFKMSKEVTGMSGVTIWQYTWTYQGDLDLGEWKQFSVLIEPLKEDIMIDTGRPLSALEGDPFSQDQQE